MNSTPTDTEWNPDENSIVILAPLLGSWHFPPLWSHRDLRVPDILISIHVKLRRYPLFKTKFCQFGLWAEKQLSPASEEQEGESGAGPSLAQPLGLAQPLLRWSKVPEHASETPPFTAWLAGPHPHTQLNQMLHNQAHQIIEEYTHIAPNC